MTMWLYQMNQGQWPPNNYRVDIWENERWSWPVGRNASGKPPEPGDRVVFFYAPSGGDEPGIYGWAIVLGWHDDERGMYFRPVPPSDQLKMHPWWNDATKKLVNEVRGTVKQGSWKVPTNLAEEISAGVLAWVSSGTTSTSS